jgi:predicted Zn-dependent protease
MPSRKEQLEAMLVDEPNDPLLRYMLAMEHVSAGADAAAVTVFAALLERSPEYVPAYMQMGQALLRLGKNEEARSAWQRGVVQARQQGNEHAAGEMQGMIEMSE